MLIAILIRVIVLLVFLDSRSEDIETFLRDGLYIINNESGYWASYFPFIGYLGAIAIWMKQLINPYLFLKIIFAIFDVALLYPLYFLSKKNSQTILIYALNPITIIVTIIHGQIDSIPLFFLLLGLVFYFKKRLVYSVLNISFAVCVKTWPILFITPLFKKSKSKFLFVLIPLIPLIFTFIHSILFNPSFFEIVSRVKNYRGVFGEWGISKLILFLSGSPLPPAIEQFIRRLFIVSFILFSVLRDDLKTLRSILISMLFFLSFTPTFGIQWIFWLVPFVLIVKPKLWKSFLVVGSVYLTFGFAWDADITFRNFMNFWDSVITGVGLLTWIFIV